MTKKQRTDHIENIKTVLISCGWLIDSWGNFRIDDYRIKMQKTSMRYELKCGSRWSKIRSDYFKNVLIKDNKIILQGKFL